MKTLKIAILSVSALLIAAGSALAQSGGTWTAINNKAFGTNAGNFSTNFSQNALPPFKLTGMPGQTSQSFAFQVKARAAAAGTSNMIFGFKFSLDNTTNFASAVTYVTNALAGTGTTNYLNTVTAPAHAKYVLLSSYSTTQTNVVTLTTTFGQHR